MHQGKSFFRNKIKIATTCLVTISKTAVSQRALSQAVKQATCVVDITPWRS